MRNLSQLTVNTGDSFEKLCPFPVGYIYLSTDSTSPASTYGGTWSELTDSRFLRPSGSWNSTGGANSHYHWTTQGYGYAELDSYAGGYTNLDGSQPSRTKTGPHFPITSTKILSMDFIEKTVHILHLLSHHTGLVTLGIAPLNLGGAY